MQFPSQNWKYYWPVTILNSLDTNFRLEHIDEFAHSYFSTGDIHASSDLRCSIEVMALLNVDSYLMQVQYVFTHKHVCICLEISHLRQDLSTLLLHYQIYLLKSLLLYHYCHYYFTSLNSFAVICSHESHEVIRNFDVCLYRGWLESSITSMGSLHTTLDYD